MSKHTDIRNIKHFIWDFDGTLFDTYPIIIQQIQTALAGFGCTVLHEASALLPVACPMESVEQVLAAIQARGGKNLIFTHRDLGSTNAYLEKYGLAHYFSDIVGADAPGFAWKPAPDAIEYLLRTHDLNPEEVAMVGDREIDLASARAASIYSVHYLCKNVPQELQCHWRFSDFALMANALI